MWIFILVLIFIVYRVRLWFPVKYPKVKLYENKLTVYYGAPGSGKSTYCTYLAVRALKSGYKVFSNVPIRGCYKITKSDLGKFAVNDCLLLWDEAGLDWNNRDFATNFSKRSGDMTVLEWFKKHRHEGVEVAIFSQGFDDADKKIRDLNTDLYIVRKSLIPNCTVRKLVKKRPDIDDLTHSPIDKYYFVRFGSNRIYNRPLWKYFDSYDRMGLPEKNWELWSESDIVGAASPEAAPVADPAEPESVAAIPFFTFDNTQEELYNVDAPKIDISVCDPEGSTLSN